MQLENEQRGGASVRGVATSASRRYLTILRRRKGIVAFAVVLGIAAAVAYSVTQDKQYAATSQVLINRQNLANALTGTPDPSASTNDFLTILQTQASIARSPEVAARVLRASHTAGMDPHGFLQASSVSPQRDADLLVFHVQSRDPVTAVRLTTLYAQQFVAYRRELDTSALAQAERQLDARLDEAQSAGSDDLVRTLQTRKQQLDTMQALQGGNAAVVRRADLAVQVSPRLKRNIVLGLGAGMVLALILTGLAEALDTRVRRREDIEGLLGMTLLAEVPPPPRAARNGLLMLESPNAPESEAFRLLRLSLEFGALGIAARSLMVTSSIEGEGKTTTVANLAVTMARAGKRVALVDLDLRRPTIARAFDVPPVPGVTDVILGHKSLDDVLVPIDVGDTVRMAAGSGSRDEGDTRGSGSLHVVPSGVLPPNPGDVAGSAPIAQLLSDLEARSDIVLVDAPPTLPVGDVLALSRFVDGIFVCVRIPQVTRSMLEDLRHELSGVGAKAMGFVVTGQTSKEDVAYRYGYGSQPGALTYDSSANGASAERAISR